MTDFLEVHEPLRASTLGSQRAFLDQRRTSDGTGEERSKNFRFDKIPSFFHQRGAWNTRQLGFFPLATTSVGWVPDQHTRRAKAKRRTRSAAESCAGGLPTENGAQGEAFTLDRYKLSSGFSEVLMLCVTVTGLWVSERRAEAISNYRLVCQECAEDGSLVAGWFLVQ